MDQRISGETSFKFTFSLNLSLKDTKGISVAKIRALKLHVVHVAPIVPEISPFW